MINKKTTEKPLTMFDCWNNLQIHCIVTFIAMKLC